TDIKLRPSRTARPRPGPRRTPFCAGYAPVAAPVLRSMDQEEALAKRLEVADEGIALGKVAPAHELPVVLGSAQQHSGDVGREETGGLALSSLEGRFTRQAQLTAESPDVGEVPRLLAIDHGRELVRQDVLGAVEQTENGVSSELADVRRDIVDHFDLQDDVSLCHGQPDEARLPVHDQ